MSDDDVTPTDLPTVAEQLRRRRKRGPPAILERPTPTASRNRVTFDTGLRRAVAQLTAQVSTTRLRQLGTLLTSIIVGAGGVFLFHLSALDDVRADERGECANRLTSEESDTSSALDRLDRCEARLDACRAPP